VYCSLLWIIYKVKLTWGKQCAFPLIKFVDFQPAAALLQSLNINISAPTVVTTEFPQFIHYRKLNNYFTACERYFLSQGFFSAVALVALFWMSSS
jgi:hypothetical protein